MAKNENSENNESIQLSQYVATHVFRAKIKTIHDTTETTFWETWESTVTAVNPVNASHVNPVNNENTALQFDSQDFILNSWAVIWLKD